MPRLAASLLSLILLAGLALPGVALAQQQVIEVRSSDFDDRDPVDFGRNGPDRYPVHGIDVARYQGTVDWHAAARAGVNFAFIKATEGGDLLDSQFAQNWQMSGRAGVLRGAYHFYYFCTDAETQAKWFIRNVPRERGALPPVLDMEWNHLSPTCQKRPSGSAVRSEMKIFLDMLHRHYGQRPVIYTTPQFYKDAGLHRLTQEEFWLRSVARPLDQVYPGQRWSFWQYSGTGIVPGLKGDVDLNAFAGSRQAWAQWVGLRQQ
ncbi:MAG: GH25 family lysozyme [Roseovarius sp.]|uniref:glycoside hydrolase family 25 protein n=1 Tax=Roseovarius sp. TaxID=1486281 RepID=UPI0032ED0AD4